MFAQSDNGGAGGFLDLGAELDEGGEGFNVTGRDSASVGARMRRANPAYPSLRTRGV